MSRLPGPAAGLATGLWPNVEDLRANWIRDKEWHAQMPVDKRELLYKTWLKAVTRTFDWVNA